MRLRLWTGIWAILFVLWVVTLALSGEKKGLYHSKTQYISTTVQKKDQRPPKHVTATKKETEQKNMLNAARHLNKAFK